MGATSFVRIFDAGEATEYVLLDDVGVGGEGQTWRATQIGRLGRERPVAVKIPLSGNYLGARSNAEMTLERWREQVQVLRGFSHRGFASVQVAFAIAPSPGDEEATPSELVGAPALVMKWIDGPSLEAWIRSDAGHLGDLRVLEECAQGLDSFHRETHHIHGDIKPSNIIIESGCGKIIDFGLVRSIDQARSQSAAFGSPGYLDPQVILGGDYTPESDLFAFAGVLYFTLVGQHPRDAKNASGLRVMLEQAGHARLGPLIAASLNPDPAFRPTLSGAVELLGHAQQVLRKSQRRQPRATEVASPREATTRLAVTRVMSSSQLPTQVIPEKQESELDMMRARVDRIAVALRSRPLAVRVSISVVLCVVTIVTVYALRAPA